MALRQAQSSTTLQQLSKTTCIQEDTIFRCCNVIKPHLELTKDPSAAKRAEELRRCLGLLLSSEDLVRAVTAALDLDDARHELGIGGGRTDPAIVGGIVQFVVVVYKLAKPSAKDIKQVVGVAVDTLKSMYRLMCTDVARLLERMPEGTGLKADLAGGVASLHKLYGVK